ncbi:biotin transporter BioY [Paenibacillus sp. GP183]|uniref:biotin transporter BioY n=1 Tax=Paenibacillus sp. GP183 TaxID=1882751 RepID=UPI000B84A229|nr:biotin transporter BioY [Paenibacillus sp. GP183]
MQTSSWNVRGLVFSALFAALFILFSLITITPGLFPVPFTLQSFALMLTGGLLGARYGFYSIFVVVALTALGLPLLHGQGGLSLILGKSGGFIWMFPVAAFAIGWMSDRIKGKGPVSYILLFVTMELFGSLLLYVTGVPWLAHAAGFSISKAWMLGGYPFLLPDMVKAIAAAGVVLSLRQFVPKLAHSRLAR